MSTTLLKNPENTVAPTAALWPQDQGLPPPKVHEQKQHLAAALTSPACVCASNSSTTHLERQQQQEGFYTVEAPVDKVTHEQVVGLRAVTPDLEQLDQVIKLPMDVPTCSTTQHNTALSS